MVCEILAYDPVTGDLPILSKSDCPICCGRQDLPLRALHPHYCNLCEGDWDHEGVCVDSLAAYCPWCLPKPNVEPAPGARRGPHYHYCSECGQNWQHATRCSAPLLAALPECPGCQKTIPAGYTERLPALSVTIPAGPKKTLREHIRPFAVPIGLAAGVLLSLPILFKSYSALQSPTADKSAFVEEPRPADSRPAPAFAPTPPKAPEPTPEVTRPRVEPGPAKSIQPARTGSSPAPAVRTPALRTEARRGRAVDRPVEQRGPSELAARPPLPVSPKADDVRATPPAPPSPARTELHAESAPSAPKIPLDLSESGARATPVVVTLPSIPGAPPFGGLTGSSARDTSLDGHPRRVAR
jgi:hypothetical protein